MLGKTRIEILGVVLENAGKCHIVTSLTVGVEKDENMYFIINQNVFYY